MPRTISAPVSTALAAESVRLAYLVELAFDSGPLRLWTGTGDFEWPATARTFTGYGELLDIAPIEETQSIEANGLSITLSGISTTLVTYALAENYRNRRARAWVALSDPATGTLLADPIPVFAGRMDTMQIIDAGDTAQVRLTCESRLIDLQRPRERRYTHEDQQELHPGDRGLEYLAGLQGREIAWGRVEPQ